VTADRRRLVIDGAAKAYGNTKALAGLSLVAEGGRITGIAGPNGAGKSTLVKALAGEIGLDSGRISLTGAAGADADGVPASAVVAVVHQETSLFPNLTVAENLAAAHPASGWRLPHTTDADVRTMRQLGILAQQHRRVIDCSLVVRQLTEIARALIAEDADVLLLDEPNSALTEAESAVFFERVTALRDEGRIVLLVTHRLPDLVSYCDQVAIVRDGRVSAELVGGEITEKRIAEELVVDIELGGRAVENDEPIVPPARAPRALVVEGWTHDRGRFSGIGFRAEPGTVTAILGNEGSGARDLLRSLGGFGRATGKCGLEGARIAYSSQFMPAERQVSLFSNLDVRENLVSRLGSPAIASRAGWLRRTALAEVARDLFRRFLVRGATPASSIRSLSGGNQQKVAIAAAAAAAPDVLLLEEPTRGVDVSSKAEIYRLLGDYAASGRVVVVYCSEVTEVFELADRFLVIEKGRMVMEREVSEFASVTELAGAVADAVKVFDEEHTA